MFKALKEAWRKASADVAAKKSVPVQPQPVEFPITIVQTALSLPDYGQIEKTGDSTWLINPKGKYPVTVYKCSLEVAERVKTILDTEPLYDRYNMRGSLTSLIRENDLRYKELDEYIARIRENVKLGLIGAVAAASDALSTQVGMDRKDMEESIIDNYYENYPQRPNCDLRSIIEYDETSPSARKRMLEVMDLDLISVYTQRITDFDKIYRIESEAYWRSQFQKLADTGRAIQGQAIPISDILHAMTLKEMNACLEGLDCKPFGRKQKAEEYLLSLPDIVERVGNQVPFREFFKVNELPLEFESLLKELRNQERYEEEVAELIELSYHDGLFFAPTYQATS